MAEADPRQPAAEPAALDGGPPVEPAPTPRRRFGRLTLMLTLPLAVLIGGVLYWLSLQGKVSTDNAYVQQDKVSIGAEVGGKIVEIAVEDGQQVAAGDLLFRVDPEPYRLQIQQADAQIAAATCWPSSTAISTILPPTSAPIDTLSC